MLCQSDPLSVSFSRSFLTALTLLGDAARAEALVVDAVETLDPNGVTGNSVRDAVIGRLVQAQIMNGADDAAAGGGIPAAFPAFSLPA
jgi:hypothetical protein